MEGFSSNGSTETDAESQRELTRANGRLPRAQHAYSAEEALQLIADKWTVEVFHALRAGRTRYGEIRRSIPGISKKMLTQTLRKLERDGLVQRTEFDVTPPHVEYGLTALAQSLLPHLTDLCRWSKQFADEVNAARREYDEQSDTVR